MRKVHPTFLVVVGLVSLGSSQALAGIRPSFMLEYCAWHASDIVVAAESDARDGNMNVLETWKGSLKKGDVVGIAELAGYRPAVGPLFGGVSSPINKVTGKRMILFPPSGYCHSTAARPRRRCSTASSARWCCK